MSIYKEYRKNKLFYAFKQVNCIRNIVIPSITYNNIIIEKASILKYNKGKSGVYR